MLKDYGIHSICGDRYAAEWVVQAFRRLGISYETSELAKSEIYCNFLPRLNSGEVEWLDNRRLITQLLALERRTARGGRDSVDHAPRGKDDLANAAAGVLVYLTSARHQPQFPYFGTYGLPDDSWRGRINLLTLKQAIAAGFLSEERALREGWVGPEEIKRDSATQTSTLESRNIRSKRHWLDASILQKGFTPTANMSAWIEISPTGQESAIQKHLRSAIRDLRDARKPIEDLKASVHSKHAAVKIPPFNGDTVGFYAAKNCALL